MNPLKARKFESPIEIIKFLEYLRDYGPDRTKERYEMSAKELKYFKQKHQAYGKDRINREIYRQEGIINGENKDYPHQNYKKQAACEHKDFKLMLKCTCSKVLSENDIDELIDILERKRESLKVGVQVFNLSSKEEVL